MEVVDYDYIEALSILDVQPESASNGTANNVPGINSPKINATSSVYNIPQQDIEQDIAGWSTSIQWSSTGYRNATYSGGTLYLPDGTSYNISGASVTLSSSNPYYFYYDTINQQVAYTTITQESVGAGKILLAVAKRNTNTDGHAIIQPFGTGATDTFITADNIAANTITGNELAANSIDGMTITGATIRTASSGKRFMMTSSYVRYYDSSNRKRVEFTGNGLNFFDTSGNQFVLYGSSGMLITDANFRTLGDMTIDGDLILSGSADFDDIYSYNGNITNLTSPYIDGLIELDFRGNTMNVSSGYPYWNSKAIPIANDFTTGTVTNNGHLIIKTGSSTFHVNARQI